MMTSPRSHNDTSAMVWLDGEFLPETCASIGVFSHGLLYGDSAFEGLRIYDGHVFELQAHLARLARTMAYLRLRCRWTLDDLAEAITETSKRNGLRNAYVRLVIFRGVGSLGIEPFEPFVSDPQALIIVSPLTLFPAGLYDHGMTAIVASTMRNHPSAMPPQIKCGNYLNNIIAKIEAFDAGAHEAIFLNHNGLIAECTTCNIFTVVNGKLLTPPTSDGALDGITRRVVMQMAQDQGITTISDSISRADLYGAEEAFVTGTGVEICPITTVDYRTIGNGVPGSVTQRLMTSFRELTYSKHDLLAQESVSFLSES